MTTDLSNSVDTHIAVGMAALKNGSTENAQAAFQAALDIEPTSFSANYGIGSSLLELGAAENALPHLQAAAQSNPTVEYVLRLAQCFEALNDIGNAIACYRAVLTKQTDNAELWSHYANLLNITGDQSGAETAYENALAKNPDLCAAITGRAWLLWKKDTKQALNFVKEALLNDRLVLRDHTQLLYILLLFTEWDARLDANLPPYHASSLAEMFFHHATRELTRLRSATSQLALQEPDDTWAQMTDAMATFASGNLNESQIMFGAIEGGSIAMMAKAVRFDEEFFNSLTSPGTPAPVDGLPPLNTVKTCDFSDADILFLSCNDSYFDAFAKPLLRSLSSVGEETQVHIHIMDSVGSHSQEALNFCKQLEGVKTALTTEQSNLREGAITARGYYHAIRFIRLYEQAKHYNSTLWMMDVDALFNRSPEHLFSQLEQADIALRVRPGRLEPWNQFNACLFGVRPTAASLDYLASISAYIAYFYGQQNLPWGIDQLAMYACFIDAQRRGKAPRLHFLDDKALDYEYLPEGILWCSSGAKKVAALSRTSEDNPNATDYDRAFMKHQDNTSIS